MDETEAIMIGRATLHRLSKLSRKEISREFSAEGGTATASKINSLLKASAEMGEWDLFEEAMGSIPDRCMTNVIDDPSDGFDVFLVAFGSKSYVPSDALLSMIRRFPSLREHKDEDGSTLLHVLCTIPNTPENVYKCIEELVSFRLEKAAMTNDDDCTPLHYAIVNSDLEIIEKLTLAFPEMVTMKTNNDLDTPLHFLLEHGRDSVDNRKNCKIIEMQVQADPSVVKCQDCNGCTPLHIYFASRGISRPNEIKALLKADPSTSKCLDNAGRTPFFYLWRHYCEKDRPVKLKNEPPVEYRRDSFVEFWRCVSMLLLAATRECLPKPSMKTNNLERWSEIDAIVELGSLVPWPLFVMAAWEHFGHPEPDADGMLPLHYAARGPGIWVKNTEDGLACDTTRSILRKYPVSVEFHDSNGWLPLRHAASCKHTKVDGVFGESEITTNIVRLVSAYPRGAGIESRFGSFPLHLAIKSGKDFCPDIESIFEASPQVLSKPDPCSRLYPFMLAAVGEKASENAIYELLRRDPNLVEMGIRESANEKYLKRRICDMASKVSEIESKLSAMESEIKEMKSRQESVVCSSPTADSRGKKRAKK